ATTLATDPAVLAEIDDIRGNLALRTGSLDDGRRLLLRAADLSEVSDPDAAAMRLSDVISGCFYQSDMAGALAAAARLERLIAKCHSEAARIRAQMGIGIARVLAGGAGVHWIRQAVDALAADPDLPADPWRPHWEVVGTLFLRESGVGRGLMERAVNDDR